MPKFVISPHFRLQEWVAEERATSRPSTRLLSSATTTVGRRGEKARQRI